MRRLKVDPGLIGAGVQHHSARLSSDEVNCDISALRPIRSVLSSRDFWQLQDHRQRCETIGGDLFLRLGRLIRAKMVDAHVVNLSEIPANVVTGTSRVAYSIDNGRSEIRTLYHWGYSDTEKHQLPVGGFLGATLIGMAAGQRSTLLNGAGVAGEVTVLSIIHQPEYASRTFC